MADTDCYADSADGTVDGKAPFWTADRGRPPKLSTTARTTPRSRYLVGTVMTRWRTVGSFKNKAILLPNAPPTLDSGTTSADYLNLRSSPSSQGEDHLFR